MAKKTEKSIFFTCGESESRKKGGKSSGESMNNKKSVFVIINMNLSTSTSTPRESRKEEALKEFSIHVLEFKVPNLDCRANGKLFLG